MTDFDFVADAGHAEYLLPGLTDAEQTEVWDPPEDLTDDEMSGFYDPSDAVWMERTGLPADMRPDAVDLSWCHVYRYRVSRERLAAAFDAFTIDLLAPGPHGDDDVYDYWPSGVRLAFEIAEHLDDQTATATLEAGVRELIAELDDDLIDSVGLDREETP